jgi:hypothetical protein
MLIAGLSTWYSMLPANHVKTNAHYKILTELTGLEVEIDGPGNIWFFADIV